MKAVSKKTVKKRGKSDSAKKRKRLVVKLEELIKVHTRLRDNQTCQKCNKWVTGSNCHTSHVIPKSDGNILRYDDLNLKILCHNCHMRWWHKNPMEAYEWFEGKFPERWAYLKSKKEQYLKLTIFALEEIVEMYEGKIENLNSGIVD